MTTNKTMEDRQRKVDDAWERYERRENERRFEVVPPRAGVDWMGRCLKCGLPVVTSAGCECTKEK